jgi:hypothetical protein
MAARRDGCGGVIRPRDVATVLGVVQARGRTPDTVQVDYHEGEGPECRARGRVTSSSEHSAS